MAVGMIMMLCSDS